MHGSGFEYFGFGLSVFKSDPVVFVLNNPPVADSGSKDVTPEIFESLFPFANRSAVNDVLPLKASTGQRVYKSSFFKRVI